MAKILPTLESIKRLKVSPTEGEWFLINYLIKNLSDDIEIYFQPFLNGDMPDIILIQKCVGVTVIEVKDWNLDLYKIDENNKWHLKKDNTTLKSPFQQVFAYKNNMFNLHIDGLLEKKLENQNFYGRISSYVYFHKATKQEIDRFFHEILDYYRDLIRNCNNDYNNNQFNSYSNYTNRLKYLQKKKSKIERDLRYCAVGNNNLDKIQLPFRVENLFTDNIYKEFLRYLQPPYHTLNEGKEIHYISKQAELIISQNKHQKVKGVAGSGKTMVLAKRAVNAHKRHGDEVLILTFNITLKSYIHDKISDVRENFSWNSFYISSYHNFMTQELNNMEIDVGIPEDIQRIIDKIDDYGCNNEKKEYIEEYFDKTYYSNIKLFENNKDKIRKKYKTILIDEIQDYKSDWIKILKTYFLEDNSEIVLFGDEKQNIYDRELDEKKYPNTGIVGIWNQLTNPLRYKFWSASQVIPLLVKFQETFLQDKYEITIEPNIKNIQPTLIEDKSKSLNKLVHYSNPKEDKKESIGYSIGKKIIDTIQKYDIHNDEVVIMASKIDVLRDIDYSIRTISNIKTITTFETQEEAENYSKDIQSIRKRRKIGFNHHSGKLKISTIHSFKGYESHTVFLIIIDGNTSCVDDNEEMVYTGITRSQLNLMIFTLKDSIYNDFFEKYLEFI